MTLQREQTHPSRAVRPAAAARAPRTAEKTLDRDHEGYLIKELQHLLRTRIEARIRAKKLGFSFPHSMVLMMLSEQPGLSGAQLARRCGVTAQTMNGLLVPLEQRGLIKRVTDPENARVLKCLVNAKGKRLLQQVMQEASAVFEQMLGALSAREREEFHRLLHRCLDGLNATPAETAALNGTRKRGRRTQLQGTTTC
ncbi:MAG: MarR family transcriptional regulator [Candidatus Obscuribacterales bacterium]|nr:MarR family transcriptional regulator [Steroidobacteraceae bacterium]